MSYLLRASGVYIILVGVAIAVHFIITPFYHAGGASFTAWHYMNWFIAPAVLITLAASYIGKRRFDGAGSGEMQRYLEVNGLFYGSIAAGIIYYWNWALTLAPNNVADGQFWSVLGAVLPILMVVAGLRLWSMRWRAAALSN